MTLKLPIYMDNHATTQVDPRVVEAMLPYFTEVFGNAASRSHSFGWTAEKAVELARDQVGALIGASGKEIVWTSGATESDNLAIKGAAEFNRDRGNHIITVQTEHKAVLDTCKRLEKDGFDVTYLPVEQDGRVNPATLRAAMTDKTILVSIMLANNETGAIQPVAAAAEIVHAAGGLLHVDAIQGFGKIPFDMRQLGADLLTLSAHKVGGPKGVGALALAEGLTGLEPLLRGGGQELSRRAGTENVGGIAAFGAATAAALADLQGESRRLGGLRGRLEDGLRQTTGVIVFSDSVPRLPNTTLFTVPGLRAETAVIGFDLAGIAVSSGSACSSGKVQPSHVLEAMGFGREIAQGAVRLSMGWSTRDADVDYCLEAWRRLADSLLKDQRRNTA